MPAVNTLATFVVLPKVASLRGCGRREESPPGSSSPGPAPAGGPPRIAGRRCFGGDIGARSYMRVDDEPAGSAGKASGGSMKLGCAGRHQHTAADGSLSGLILNFDCRGRDKAGDNSPAEMAEQNRSPWDCSRSAASRYEARRLCDAEQRGLAIRGSPAKRSPAASSPGRLSSSSALLSARIHHLNPQSSTQPTASSNIKTRPGGLKPFCSGRRHQSACCEHPRDLRLFAEGNCVFGIPGGLKPFCSGRRHQYACCEHPRDLRLFAEGSRVFAIPGGLKPFCSGRRHQYACCEHPRDLRLSGEGNARKEYGGGGSDGGGSG